MNLLGSLFNVQWGLTTLASWNSNSFQSSMISENCLFYSFLLGCKAFSHINSFIFTNRLNWTSLQVSRALSLHSSLLFRSMTYKFQLPQLLIYVSSTQQKPLNCAWILLLWAAIQKVQKAGVFERMASHCFSTFSQWLQSSYTTCCPQSEEFFNVYLSNFLVFLWQSSNFTIPGSGNQTLYFDCCYTLDKMFFWFK